MKRNVAILLLVIYLSSAVAQGDVKVPVTSGKTSASSSGSSRAPDIENFIRQVESWKNNYNDRFEYLQKLLYKPAWTNTSYIPPDVWLYYPLSDNNTINRTDEIKVEAIIQNTNPIEIRRALFLSLEIMEPGESSFKPAEAGVQIIQVNEYDENEKTSRRVFPEISSFKFLKRVGEVKLRVSWTDGEYKLYSSRENSFPDFGYYPELAFNIKNIPPKINNSTLKVDPMLAKWDDYIQYTASFGDTGKALDIGAIADKEKNPEQVTLHIYNRSNEIFNITKPFLQADAISFSTKDANIFKEKDAGKNFTYRYSCTDNIMGGNNTTWTELADGPHIRPNPKIKVTDLNASCEDQNYYWWQNYNFGLKIKSRSAEPINVIVDLYLDSSNHPGKRVSSQSVVVPGNDSIDVIFKDVKPFDVADVNQTFRYYFGYSAPDQDGKRQSNSLSSPRAINSKLVRYEIYSWEIILNILLIVGVSMASGILLERRILKKGGK
jgi:hypothetical protein